MRIFIHEVDLVLRHPFTISRGSRAINRSVIVEIEHSGISGLGEAAPSARYGETPETVTGFLAKIDFSKFRDPFLIEDINGSVDSTAPGNTSAKAAIDIALHDWIGKILNIPLWKMWGLHPEKTPRTSFTIGIDRPDRIEQKIREAEPYPILKVKVGVPDDEEIIRTIRSLTDKPLRVDANEGWISKEIARDKILWMEEQGVELVEQPLRSDDLGGTAWLREQVHIPIFADENVTRLSDVPKLHGIFDGINIKLMKCGGLREAMRMIHTAKAVGLKVMLGCMIESSVGISAAAHLSPLADYADLDGSSLITNDPYDGVTIEGGRLILNDRPGIGVERRSS